MHFERHSPSRASKSKTRTEGRHDQDPDPLSREGHQVPPARTHRLEV